MRTVSADRCGLTMAVMTAVAVVASCGEPSGSHPSPGAALEALRSRSVAEGAAVVDGRELALSEFRSYWKNRPGAARSEVVDDVVERELAVQRGIRAGEHEASSLSFVRKRAMVRALLDREIDRKITESDLAPRAIDEEISKLRARAGRPAGIRASHLLVKVGSSAEGEKPDKSEDGKAGSAEDRAAARRWAQRLRGKLPEHPDIPELFELKHRYADELPEPLRLVVDVNLVFPAPDARRFEGELPNGWMTVVEAFAEAADSGLEESSTPAISDPVESRYGWHLVLPAERLPAKVPESEPLRRLAVSNLLQRRRAKRFKTLVGRWMSGASVATFPGALDDEKISHSPGSK